MRSFVLRVEGVNLSNVIDDTDDLSTRRGGGLMILQAARQLGETLPRDVRERLCPIARGASIGLFSFQAKDRDDAESLAAEVRRHFRAGTLEYPSEEQGKTEHLPLRHGTFVVDVAEIGADAAGAVELATARNRWRQMEEPSLSLDDLWVDGVEDACALDYVRPANAESHSAEGERLGVSASVAARRAFGRGARQRFYEATCGLARDEARFTDDFQTLASAAGLDRGVAPENATDKLAVFYVDGNQFGKKGREHLAAGIESFGEWSRALEAHHEALLRGLVDRARKGPGWKNRERIRVETLLWGGDEILWVVPAWKGWELVEWFFGCEHRVKVGGRDHALSYGCGLVFCHVKAPIQDIVTLAHDLGDLAKDQGRAANQHRLAYEVMESFDALASELDDHRRLVLPPETEPGVLVLDPGQGEEFWSALRAIAGADDMPMRQLYRAARAWREGGDLSAPERRLLASKVGPHIEAFRHAFAGEPVAWLHLLQMLPYIPAGLEGAS